MDDESLAVKYVEEEIPWSWSGTLFREGPRQKYDRFSLFLGRRTVFGSNEDETEFWIFDKAGMKFVQPDNYNNHYTGLFTQKNCLLAVARDGSFLADITEPRYFGKYDVSCRDLPDRVVRCPALSDLIYILGENRLLAIDTRDGRYDDYNFTQESLIHPACLDIDNKERIAALVFDKRTSDYRILSRLLVMDLETGTITARRDFSESITHLLIKGETIILASEYSGSVQVRSLKDLTVISTIRAQGIIIAIDNRNNNTAIYYKNGILLYRRFLNNKKPQLLCKFASDGFTRFDSARSLIIHCHRSGTVELFDPDTQKTELIPPPEKNLIPQWAYIIKGNNEPHRWTFRFLNFNHRRYKEPENKNKMKREVVVE
jgi:hypothetical protein